MSTELNLEQRRQRVKELEEEMAALKLDIVAENNTSECNERYEELLEHEPWTFVKSVQEALDFSTQVIRDHTTTELEQLLDFFNGKSPSAKKHKLIIFLKEFPCYRTKDFKKLRSRFFCLRLKGREALKNGTDNTNFYNYAAELGFDFRLNT